MPKDLYAPKRRLQILQDLEAEADLVKATRGSLPLNTYRNITRKD